MYVTADKKSLRRVCPAYMLIKTHTHTHPRVRGPREAAELTVRSWSGSAWEGMLGVSRTYSQSQEKLESWSIAETGRL